MLSLRAHRFTWPVAAVAAMALAGCRTDGDTGSNEPVAVRAASGTIRYAPTPAKLLTPETVETRIGTLEFFDGLPSADTVRKVYDHLDFLRGVRVFLDTMGGASLVAMRQGFLDAGGTPNRTVLVTESLMDSRTLFLTANTETVYAVSWLDLREGPVVVQSPPGVLGFLDDFWHRHIVDIGNAGPDRGKGGKYLVLPPGYEGEAPEEGYFTVRSPTYGVWVILRGFLVEGDPGPAVDNLQKGLRIHPLASAGDPPATEFVDVSGKSFNTIHANTIEFHDEVREVVDEEPADAFSPEILGLLAAIGVRKGAPFAPDERMREILEEAAAVGNATARAISFRPRDPRASLYEDSAWFNPFVGGSHEFLREAGGRDLDARTMFHYPYTAVSPAMAIRMVGVGSQYAIAAVDASGEYLDGSETYHVTLPAGIPAKDFWSFVLYDPQTRSILQTPRTAFPSLSSQKPGVVPDPDGGYTVWFGPEPPAGKESNWIQTVPGKGWFIVLRIYGPLESWFDGSWKPGEIEG